MDGETLSHNLETQISINGCESSYYQRSYRHAFPPTTISEIDATESNFAFLTLQKHKKIQTFEIF